MTHRIWPTLVFFAAIGCAGNDSPPDFFRDSGAWYRTKTTVLREGEPVQTSIVTHTLTRSDDGTVVQKVERESNGKTDVQEYRATSGEPSVAIEGTVETSTESLTIDGREFSCTLQQHTHDAPV